MEQDNQQETALEPLEQETISFHDQSIIAVRLADGRICVVLRWVCESLNLSLRPQIRRIQRTTDIADELVNVKVETSGRK